MKKPNINTAQRVIPMIYAYTTPEIARHNGWTKIGYTEQDVETRIKQQTHTADIRWHLEWKGNATFDDGSGDRFTDKDFHAYLRKEGIEQEKGKNNEWFHITGLQSKSKFYEFRSNRGMLESLLTVIPYTLRKEQEDAVSKTLAYRTDHPNGEYLWNAKPRFGKTLSVYDFCKKSRANTVLIVTNRPAIANSWYEDYMQFVGKESGYCFVSEVDALRGKPGVMSRQEYIQTFSTGNFEGGELKCIEFVSLQDMKGSKYFSTNGIDKLEEVAKMTWDILVIDEAHEGIDTYKTDIAFARINRKFTLHLSGTPFKALANNKFAQDAIFNWTYADEQTAKRDWDETAEEENPYARLPRLNLFTYQMSEIIKEELSQGVEINGETEEYAFDLNEFFSTNLNGQFRYDASVDRFLDAMTLQEKFPFSTSELRDELKHTFWLLDRVDSAKALARKLSNHPVFKDYEVVLAAGDGRLDEESELKNSYDKVVTAIKSHEKTITLSVGQLTTGVTIPEWTAVLMLSNVKSPSLYMQAAFRAQNPCMFRTATGFARKENAYVFDFDPARTLTIFEEFANDLSADTSAGRGNLETRERHIKELLNFFPVIGEDEDGELIELDAEKVLSIPRKIRSVEVVRRGFMSNFLFQNISQIFGAPKAVLDIIQGFEAVEEPKNRTGLSEEVKQDLSLNENGEVELSDEIVIGVTNDVFGDKIFLPGAEIRETVADIISTPKTAGTAAEELKKTIHSQMTKEILEVAQNSYGDELKSSDKRKLEARINGRADHIIDKAFDNFAIDKNLIERERDEALQARHETGKSTSEINREFETKLADKLSQFHETLQSQIADIAEESKEDVVKTVETNKREREKSTIEEGIRDHLRGFARTIPSFLMAYGDDTVTLATFDKIIPDHVFKEVTSISLDQFRLLRDGGLIKDPETGDDVEYAGHLFDPVVFDDSVKEFLSLKKKLANYFDESSVEDIFDYIPPQKTNQIFTPKEIVKKMVDLLEEENPGCFDRSDSTYIDLYMKSGLYIAEIVKRLYQSEALKRLYPDKEDRLRHIFEKQVYGLAPTEIIYKIATSYILGFDDGVKIPKHNFKQLDALPYAKDGTLQEKIDEMFGK